MSIKIRSHDCLSFIIWIPIPGKAEFLLKLPQAFCGQLSVLLAVIYGYWKCVMGIFWLSGHDSCGALGVITWWCWGVRQLCSLATWSEWTGLVQDCCISTASAVEILQYCIKPVLSESMVSMCNRRVGLVQGCGISSALALEIPQSCTEAVFSGSIVKIHSHSAASIHY